MTQLQFLKLNDGWNAEPNALSLHVSFDEKAALLTFELNPWLHSATPGEKATLRFENCSRWNWDATNDEGWYSGEGRYARQAPAWGEFYEVKGEEKLGGEIDWEILFPDPVGARHFLFYFRDETLEFIATDWSMTRHGA